MPVPEVDFNQQVVQLLPSAQRLQNWEIFAQANASPVAKLYEIFKGYMNGEAFLPYDGAATYGVGDKAQYNFSTYESLVAGNTGNQPDINVSGDDPKWLLRNKYFIGASERVKYNGRYLTLTYALNRYFGTTFRQPPYPAPYDYGLGGGTFSDIYITNAPPDATSFLFTTTGVTGSAMYRTYSTGVLFTIPVISGATTFRFTIHIPLSVYTALGATAAIRESIVREFANKYVVANTFYTIVTY